MTRVTLYKANDGSFHEKAVDCEKRNAELRLQPAAHAFAQMAFTAPGDGVTVDLGRSYIGSAADLATFIVANAEALRTILNDAFAVKRPRKAAALKAA